MVPMITPLIGPVKFVDRAPPDVVVLPELDGITAAGGGGDPPRFPAALIGLEPPDLTPLLTVEGSSSIGGGQAEGNQGANGRHGVLPPHVETLPVCHDPHPLTAL